MLRLILLYSFVFALFLPRLAAQVPDPQEAAGAIAGLPDPIREGITYYLNTGKEQALIYWKEQVLPRSRADAFEKKMNKVLDAIDKPFGRLDKVEVIMQREVTSSYWQYYLLFGFEEGVVFMRFDVYTARNELALYDVELSSDPDKILPPLRELAD